MQLISKQNLLRFLNIDDDDDRYDSIILMYLSSITPLFEYHLRRKLTKQTASQRFEYIDCDPHYLFLNRYPIDDSLTPVSLTYRDSLSNDEVDVSDNLIIDKDEGSIIFISDDSSLSRFKFGLTAYWEGGYDVVTGDVWDYLNVPTAISTAAALQTAYLFDLHQRGGIGTELMSGVDPNSKKVDSSGSSVISLLHEVLLLLKPYVRRKYLLGKSDSF